MKIAIASDENRDLDSRAAQHFGRCPFYVFITVDENNEVKEVETVENPYFNGHAPGVVPQFIADKDADVIIAGGMGPKAVEWFNQLGVKALTASAPKVSDVLEKYISGELTSAEACDESHHH